jgi:hypothetical protein
MRDAIPLPLDVSVAQIPAADLAKYRSVRDARDWLNP